MLASDQDQNAGGDRQDVQQNAEGGDQRDVAHEGHQDQPDSQAKHAEVLREDDSHAEMLLPETAGCRSAWSTGCTVWASVIRRRIPSASRLRWPWHRIG